MAGFLVNIVKRCSGKKGEKLETMLFDALQEYQQCAASLKENKTVLIKTIMITTIQMLAMHSVPYWVYLSLGLSDCSAVTMILLQAVLFASVSALPLPGAMGVSEGAFSILFGTLFTSGLLPGAMVLSRSISFYLPLAVSGFYTLMLVLTRQKSALQA